MYAYIWARETEQRMGPKCVTGWACMHKGENGPGGFAKILTDGPSPHVCVHMGSGNRATDGPKMCDWLVGMLGNKGNRWAQNMRPGGRAMPEDRPSGLHVILKITTDGPTVDFISEKANWASAYADAVSETVTDGPSLLCLNSEKATDWAQSPMDRITSGGVSGEGYGWAQNMLICSRKWWLMG
ncbi:uncharacterized protein F5891DRAFT_979170 [Suillus fuscotomentosus]|uniref:Uncharacterized protein n=1 Tax=Suillus fuscotomentosus TaxID=1912939 RepID=A0AAD4EB17_9AGAM|nr:uncharacterized protein F5891DRAFT_979170 [Suillus fuscotomentosus]KAG1901653.1 hypothetical protein F5891DRAFT_979170 [Suillus fuscotomentosus]